MSKDLSSSPKASNPERAWIQLIETSPPDCRPTGNLSLSRISEPLQATPSTSGLSRAAQPPMHVAKPGPTMRQNGSTSWPHGILSGGVLIDILEHLSATSRPSDWLMALWLQEHYITPFGRVERLDGLIVTNTEDMCMIQSARERYIELVGSGVTVQRLWVPGLEPTYMVARDMNPLQLLTLPRHFEQTVWRASDMYYKNGFEVARKGLGMGNWKDELGWGRKIWMSPDHATHTEYKKQSNQGAEVKAEEATIDGVSSMDSQGPKSDPTESESSSPVDSRNNCGLLSPSRTLSRSPSMEAVESSRTVSPERYDEK